MEDKRAIVVAGVSGCGKSTLGQALAAQIGWTFIEADEFHSPAAKAKMTAGRPLDDADRAPWLAALNAELLRRAPAVLACSALKQTYRDVLSKGLTVQFVWIDLSRELATERVAGRRGHFMPACLLDSQFAIAEVPQAAIVLSAGEPVKALLRRSSRLLRTFVSGD